MYIQWKGVEVVAKEGPSNVGLARLVFPTRKVRRYPPERYRRWVGHLPGEGREIYQYRNTVPQLGFPLPRKHGTADQMFVIVKGRSRHLVDCS